MWKEKLSRLGFYLSYLIVRAIVALRYRIEVVGLDKIRRGVCHDRGGLSSCPIIPRRSILSSWKLSSGDVFARGRSSSSISISLKGFRFFLDLARVLPIPTMDTSANKWRAKKVEKQFNHIVDELRMGENFLIYPSGRLKIQDKK